MLKQTQSGVAPWVTTTDHLQGSSCSSAATLRHCLAMGSSSETLRGDTMGSRTMDLIEHCHFDAPFCVYQLSQRKSHVLRCAPAASHAILWDIHAMSAATDTKKLKSFLPLWKSHWDPSTKWLRNQSYPKLSISSSSDAPSSLSFPMSSLLNGCKQAQRKLILNSPPAKPHSKKADPC